MQILVYSKGAAVRVTYEQRDTYFMLNNALIICRLREGRKGGGREGGAATGQWDYDHLHILPPPPLRDEGVGAAV